jgi:hypothetical protein
VRRIVVLAAVFVAASGVTAARAFAAAFTLPSSSPIVVAVDAQHHPKALTISVRGFLPGSLVYVSQCDGVSPASPQWSASEHCDLGNSPAAAVVDVNGAATFDPADRAHAFVPFAGESPQSIFNCVPAGDRAPNNGLPTFATCQVRVASNATTVTSDQIFAPLLFPRGARTAPPASSTPTTKASALSTSIPKSAPHVPVKRGRDRTRATSTTTSGPTLVIALPSAKDGSSSSGLLALSDPVVATGDALLVAGLALVGGLVWRTRRRAAARAAAR